MKTKWSVAAMALLLASCSSNDTDNPLEGPVGAVPIRVSQSVQGMAVSRGAVIEGSEVTATVLMHDGNQNDWTSFTAVTKNTLTAEGKLDTRATVSNATFTVGAEAANLGLNPALYHDNGDTSPATSYLAAVSPAGEVNGTVVKILQADGLQDVMYAPEVSAGSKTSQSTATLVFGHLTTQLRFALKLERVDASSTGEWSGKTVSVKTIEVQDAYRPASVDAKDGSVVWERTNDGTLAVPGFSNAVLSETAVLVGQPVMIQPASKVTVCVILTVGDADIPFHNVPVKAEGGSDLVTVKAQAHLITLTVKEPKSPTDGVKVAATATVTPWQTGAAGSATLE